MVCSARRRAGLFFVACTLAGLWVLTNLEVETAITHFLPDAEARDASALARAVSESELNRTATLLVRGAPRPELAEVAAAFAQRLAQQPEVASVRRGPTPAFEEAFYRVYFPRRLLFLSSRPAELADRVLSDAGLREAALDLRRRLASPAGALIRPMAEADPLLFFMRHMERVREAQGAGLDVEHGQFFKGQEAVLFVTSRASAFDGAAARVFVEGIEEAFAPLQPGGDRELELALSSVHRIAVRAEDTIRADITRISVVSMLGVLGLFFWLFRSLRLLFLVTAPLMAGLGAGVMATQLVFGRVHGLSLAFGATLIGVAVDYVIHYVNHHTLRPSPAGPVGSLRTVWPGLFLGATTTVAGLVGLAWTSFPGVRELALLTAVGVATALFATRVCLPPFLPDRPVPTPAHRALSSALGHGLGLLRARPWLLRLLPAVALAISIVGISRLSWTDDLRALTELDPTLMREDEAVREAVSQIDGGRFIAAVGDDEESALRRNDRVYRRLMDARAAGELSRVSSLSPLLPSQQTQEENWRALGQSQVVPRAEAALTGAGFVGGSFGAFAAATRHRPPALTLADVEATPLSSLVAPFLVRLDGRVAVLTFTRAADLEAVAARVSDVPGVLVFDQARFLERAYRAFRRRTLLMSGVGLLLVFALVALRYRKLRPALSAYLPALLAAATALGVLGLLGFSANLMHVTALLLVLSMGVDYGVFLVEMHHAREGVGPTVVSLTLACLSTMLSFGMLALSQNQALASLGVVTAVGVCTALLLSPTAWMLLLSEDDRV